MGGVVKRYQVDIDPDGYRTREHPDGEWVRAEDAEAEVAGAKVIMAAYEKAAALDLSELAKLRAVVDALPKCEHMSCQRGRPVATRIVWWDEGVEYYCDDCDCGRELPYADALRALESK